MMWRVFSGSASTAVIQCDQLPTPIAALHPDLPRDPAAAAAAAAPPRDALTERRGEAPAEEEEEEEAEEGNPKI